MTDSTEFERIAKENANGLYACALVLVRSAADAEDASEEALYRLFSRKKPFENDSHAKAWLVRVTINAALKILRHRKHFTDDEEAFENLSEQFDYKEHSEIFNAVTALDVKYRTVILLYYYENMSTAEIASILKISRSAVTTRLSRAREKLRTELELKKKGDIIL